MRDDQRLVPRLVESNENSQLFTITHSILTFPVSYSQFESLAVMPGLGEDSRVIKAIRIWEDNPHLRYLLVCGTNKSEVIQSQLSLDRLKEEPFLLRRVESVLTQVEAVHTREQTDWIIKHVETNNLTSLGLVVSHWHMTRAYLAILKSMLNAGVQIPIFPIVVSSSPETVIPEMKAKIKDLSAGEAERIKKYQEIGQIAYFDELMQYLEWLWSQDIN
jgi:hypothetical protein